MRGFGWFDFIWWVIACLSAGRWASWGDFFVAPLRDYDLQLTTPPAERSYLCERRVIWEGGRPLQPWRNVKQSVGGGLDKVRTFGDVASFKAKWPNWKKALWPNGRKLGECHRQWDDWPGLVRVVEVIWKRPDYYQPGKLTAELKYVFRSRRGGGYSITTDDALRPNMDCPWR